MRLDGLQWGWGQVICAKNVVQGNLRHNRVWMIHLLLSRHGLRKGLKEAEELKKT